MAYTNFENLKQVNEKLKIKIKRDFILSSKSFEINSYYYKVIIRNLQDETVLVSEASICEKLIAPIINEVAYYNNLKIWSHIQFDLEGSDDLKGVPDYLIGVIDDDATSIKNPILCLGEAKKEDFVKGWAQVAAEMFVAHKKNENAGKSVPIYGLVTTGKEWEFGILEDNLLRIDKNRYSSRNLQELFDILNWVFCECRKNLDKICSEDKK